jgi:hypothetical protein
MTQRLTSKEDISPKRKRQNVTGKPTIIFLSTLSGFNPCSFRGLEEFSDSRFETIAGLETSGVNIGEAFEVSDKSEMMK